MLWKIDQTFHFVILEIKDFWNINLALGKLLNQYDYNNL